MIVLPAQLRPLLGSRSWETRVATGWALEAVAKNVPAWRVPRARPGGDADVAGARATGENDSSNWLTFSTFSVDDVVDQGAALLASSGTEYDVDASAMGAQQLSAQHRKLHAQLGLREYDAAAGLHEIVGDEDLAQTAAPSELKRTAADMIGAAGMADGLTVRERNRAKRVARAKRQDPDQDSGTGAAASAAEPAGDGDAWPFQTLCSCARQDLLHPSWEVRHGAAICLRALVCQHASSLGAAPSDDPVGQEAQSRAFSEDLAVRVCFVIALDHFGDYAAESVVAPVRETCAQILGALSANLQLAATRGLLSVLIRMQTRGEWHVRHASFLALKYTGVLCVDSVEDLPSQLVPVIVHGLSDSDDEVRAAAAETLVPLCSKLLGVTQVAQHLKSAAQRCWQILMDDDSNVTTMAMMKLATALDFGNWLEPDLGLLHARVRRVLMFLHHTSVEVRETSIRMLSIMAVAVADSSQGCTEEFCEAVLCKMLYVLMCETVDDLVQKAATLWQSLLDVLPTQHLVAVASRIRAWITLVATHDGQLACPSAMVDGLGRCEATDVSTEWHMHPDARQASRCRLRCCRALGALVSKCPSEVSARVISATVSAFGNSLHAWERHCCALLLACSGSFASELSSQIQVTAEQICRTACVNLEGGECYAELRGLHGSLRKQFNCLQDALSSAAAVGQVSSKFKSDLAKFCSASDIIDSALQLCTVVFDEYLAILQNQVHRSRETTSDLVNLLLQLRENTAATIGRYTQERARFDTAVMSSGAAALISKNMIPAKLNPVVKSLMNAIKREQSFELQRFAAGYLVKLMDWCRTNGKIKVSDRMLHNICALLCDTSELDTSERVSEQHDEDEVDDEAARQHASRGAAMVLTQLCTRHAGALFAEVPALHQAVSVTVMKIHETRTATDAEVLEAAASLRVCGVLSASLQGDALSAVVVLIPAVLHCIGFGKSKMLTAACRCLGSISRRVSTVADVMHALLAEVISMLADSVRPSTRLGAAYALHEVLTVLDMELVPYLTQLLVPIMGAMSDSSTVVRRVATNSFCALVKLMPLEAGTPPPPGLTSTMLAAREGQRKFIAQLVGDQPLEPYAVPFSLSTPLRRYQQDGVNWLAFLRSFRLHGILCDEMGLGKTLTTLCIIVGDAHDRKQAHLKAKSNESAPLPSLVVCPATLVGHWHDEVHKHCQSPISAVQYVGAPRLREALRSSLLDADVVIVSYETVRTDIEFLASFCFNYCVLDEGHTIRNSKTKVTQAVKRLVSNHRLILSGTPVQNSALELWSMFDFLMPGFLGTERQFNERFSRAIDSSKLQKHAGDKAILAMEGLHRQVLPFILGRTKQQVLSDLPPKIIQDVMCDISPLQKRLYDQFEKSTPCRNAVASLAKSGTSAPGNVLQSLQYMRKVCNHPALVLTDSHPLRASIVAELESSGSSLRDLQHAPKLIALRCEYVLVFLLLCMLIFPVGQAIACRLRNWRAGVGRLFVCPRALHDYKFMHRFCLSTRRTSALCAFLRRKRVRLCQASDSR